MRVYVDGQDWIVDDLDRLMDLLRDGKITARDRVIIDRGSIQPMDTIKDGYKASQRANGAFTGLS